VRTWRDTRAARSALVVVCGLLVVATLALSAGVPLAGRASGASSVTLLAPGGGAVTLDVADPSAPPAVEGRFEQVRRQSGTGRRDLYRLLPARAITALALRV
jgi:hypothetical protein